MDKGNPVRCECGNVICVREENAVEIRKHKRIVFVVLRAEQYITITCENCGKTTKLKGESNEQT